MDCSLVDSSTMATPKSLASIETSFLGHSQCSHDNSQMFFELLPSSSQNLIIWRPIRPGIHPFKVSFWTSKKSATTLPISPEPCWAIGLNFWWPLLLSKCCRTMESQTLHFVREPLWSRVAGVEAACPSGCLARPIACWTNYLPLCSGCIGWLDLLLLCLQTSC